MKKLIIVILISFSVFFAKADFIVDIATDKIINHANPKATPSLLIIRSVVSYLSSINNTLTPTELSTKTWRFICVLDWAVATSPTLVLDNKKLAEGVASTCISHYNPATIERSILESKTPYQGSNEHYNSLMIMQFYVELNTEFKKHYVSDMESYLTISCILDYVRFLGRKSETSVEHCMSKYPLILRGENPSISL